jgi:nucleoside 2-deoxyribosyltransferase
MCKKVYLAGQWNEYENNWKKEFKKLKGFKFFDPEVDSRQGNPDEFFLDDMKAIKKADVLVANPGVAP